ncbi:MAG: hypothetical protein WCJ25_01645, partial [Candidatus Moraniibacteriota bacterium]
MAKRIFSILIAILISLPYQTFSAFAIPASNHVWDTQEDFANGTTNNTSVSQSSGDVTLSNLPGSVSDTRVEDFQKGTTMIPGELGTTTITDTNGGEVGLNQGWTYSTFSSPAIANDSVNHSFLDPATKYLYVSTDSGLSVIDTTKTGNDALVMKYSTDSSPAIADDYVYHSFLDPATKYLYVSTDGGL